MGKIGLQLYSVRDKTGEDFLGTLREVGKMGYDGVQFAGFFETPAIQVKKTMDEVALRSAGTHMGIDTLLGDQLNETLAYNKAIGSDLVICPWLPEEMRTDADAYRRTAETLNAVGEKCQQEGFVFGYHNHDFEFQKLNDGKRGFDILFDNTDPNLVKMELDCYWVTYAGYDPLKIIEKYRDRCVSLHMKDMKRKEGKKVSTEIGNGELDISRLLEAGNQYGVQWFTVEQEDFENDSLVSAEINLRNLKK